MTVDELLLEWQRYNITHVTIDLSKGGPSISGWQKGVPGKYVILTGTGAVQKFAQSFTSKLTSPTDMCDPSRKGNLSDLLK